MRDPAANGPRGAAPLFVATLVLVLAVPASVDAHHYRYIQPGVAISTPVGGCTLNFIFQDANTLELYAGTAAHCVTGNAEQNGDRISVPQLGPFGTVVYNGFQHDAADFSLIKIDPGRYDQVFAALRFWGGPSGVATSPTLGQGTLHYGHGVGFGTTEATRPREGVLEYVISSGSLRGYYGAIHPGVPGDSGSAVLTSDGKALGILTHIRFFSGSTIEGPTMVRILEDLAANGWGQIVLVTSAFRPLTDEARITDDAFDTRVEKTVDHCRDTVGLLDRNTGCVTTG
ncbi:MAG: hypothetical protein ACRELA_08770 [Candidatus Rokuibacteriota bacterium]